MKWPPVWDPLFIICSFKTGFCSFKVEKIQEENALLAQALSVTLRLRAKVLLHVWSYDFYDTMLSTPITAMSYDKNEY